jgi:dipeptidyl aminopeptidase/acylaminoacyl peptidase
MKASFLFLATILCAALSSAASSPSDRQVTDPKSVASVANPASRSIPIADLYFTRSVGGPAWSPDGREVSFRTNLTGRDNLWKVNASGGWPIQLAQSDDRQHGATWSPDGRWIVYQQDQGGNELWDLYAVPSAGGDVINLTSTPDVREESPHWSPDGRHLAVEYKPQASTVYDIAVMDWPSHQVRKLTNEATKDHSWEMVAWSPDGKRIYANRGDVTFTDSDIYAIDLASGQVENLTPHQGKILYMAAALSPDGKALLITSTQKGGYFNVARLNVGSRQIHWVTDTQWEATANDISPDGKWFAYAVNEDGRSDIYLGEMATGLSHKLDFPAGVNEFAGNPHAFSPQSDRLLIEHESSTKPADIWIYNLKTRTSTQLTFSAVASLASAPLPQSQIVHYKSFDGKMISALLWVPFNLQRDGSNPALVLPHGGPTGQTQDYWSPRIAAFVSRGYVCIAPNVRGSTGYGMDFQRANYQDLGGGDLEDEVYAARFLQETGYVDAKKIGITGGSYGGYMTLIALGKTPNTWAAGVELYGIINWFTMLQHEDPLLQEYEKGLLGDPEKDRAVYENASPIKYIHDVKAPLLVLQGANDPRVPKEEAEQIVEALQKDGKTVDVHYYPNEGHGFAKRENQIDSIQRTLEWFDQYLKAKQN